jgi:hypothetical protein
MTEPQTLTLNEITELLKQSVQDSPEPAWEDVLALLRAAVPAVEGMRFGSGHDRLQAAGAVHNAISVVVGLRPQPAAQDGEMRAGVGAVATGAGELHPEAMDRPRTAEQIRAHAAKEPDPGVRAKVLEAAERAEAAQTGAR